MLKNLLYLYNDGHNPFPKLGKGGLGYHLPQYKQTIKGGTLELDENGEPYKFDNLNDNFFVIGPDGTVIGTYNVDPTDNFLELKLIKDDDVTLSKTTSPNIESKVIPKPQTNAKYIDDSNEFGEKYNYDLYVRDTPADYKVSQVESRLNKYYDVMRFTNRELDEQIDDLIKRAPILFDSTEYRKSNFKNMTEKRNALINMQTLIEALSEVPTDEYDEIIEKHKKAKTEQDEDDAEEERLIAEQEKARLQLVNDEPIDTLISTIRSKPIAEQLVIVKKRYYEILQYYIDRQSDSGKGYEKFLVEGGSSILKSQMPNLSLPNVSSEDITVVNYDDPSMIKDKTARENCVVDMLVAYKGVTLKAYPNLTKLKTAALCEAKDFKYQNMLVYDDPENNYIAIQITKLCGFSFKDYNGNTKGYELHFMERSDGSFFIRNFLLDGKSISKERYITDYFLSINAQKGTWVCNLLENKDFCDMYINKNTMTRVVGTNNIYYIDSKKIPKYTDILYGNKPQPSIRIPKKLFKNVIKE
jgi:hypothetical protein